MLNLNAFFLLFTALTQFSLAGAAFDCKDYANIAIPEADGPTEAEAAQYTKCNSESLYYREKKFDEARKCAYAERKLGKPIEIGGPGVLLMIYANGQSVPANVDLAIRFACEYQQGYPAQRYRLKDLVAMKTKKPPKEIDVCDEASGGYFLGYCNKLKSGK